MQITSVKIQDSGYLVNGSISVPESQNNSDYISIQDWLLGKTTDWLILEATFISETSIHDNWLKIQSYESDLAQFVIDLNLYENWTWSVGTPERPTNPENIVTPSGYYTQEAVTDAAELHDEWTVGYNLWNIDSDPLKPDTYWVKEPEIRLLPENIIEPTITALPSLVPNVADPMYTLAEMKDLKIIELKYACNLDIESNFTSDALGIDYEYESTLKDQINISGAAQANTSVDFTVIDAIGNKLRVNHTAAQMNEVFTDGVIVMQTKKNRLYILLLQVNSASSETDLNNITW